MVAVARGYYCDGDVVFYVAAEAPLGQYVFRGGQWVPLSDGFFLMDKLITGDVNVDGPFDDPPGGVPDFEFAAA